MSISWSLGDDGVVYVLQTGLTSVEAMDRSVSAFYPWLELASNPVRILWDGRSALADKSGLVIRRAASRIRTLPPLEGARLALLVSTDLQFGLARLGGAYLEMEGLQVRVYRDRSEALTWLESAEFECD